MRSHSLCFGKRTLLADRPADSSAGRRLQTPSAPLRAAWVAEEAQCPLSRLVARPMTQSDAYRAGRGLMVRLARWRSQPAPFCSSRTNTKKAAHPAPKVPTATAAAPHNAHVYTQAPRQRPHAAITITQKRAAWLPQDGIGSTPGSDVDDADARGDPRRLVTRRPEER